MPFADASPTPPSPVGWRCFRALMPGFLIANLEGSVVNVALPDLSRDLAVPLSLLGWIPMACLIPTAALSPLMGVIADRAGRRRVYVGGLLLMIAGSALAAAAHGFAMLLIGRVVQGVAAAALIANGLALVAEQFGAHERGRALGLMTAVVAIGAVIAAPLGGALAQYVGWRGIFVLSLLVASPGVYWMLERVPPDRAAVPGWWLEIPWLTALSLTGVISLAITTVWGAGQWGWSSPGTLATLAGAVIAAIATRRVSVSSRTPLLELDGLSWPTVLSLGALAVGSAITVALGYALPLYLNARWGLTGLDLGLFLIPFPIGLVAGAVAGGYVGDRHGTAGPVIGGLTLIAVGLAAYSRLGHAALALAGSGLGAFSVGNNAELVHGRKHQVGSLTGVVGLVRLSFQVLGVAVATAVIGRYGPEVDPVWIGAAALPGLAIAMAAYRRPAGGKEG